MHIIFLNLINLNNYKNGGKVGIALLYSRGGEWVTKMDVLNLNEMTGFIVYEITILNGDDL
jgi:hypothetical protein